MGELVKSAANTDGFTHSQSGFNYKLYNGSSVTSLSGDVNNNRGKRSNLNVYDESGWTSEEYVVATIPFLLQNSTFRLGGNMDVGTFLNKYQINVYLYHLPLQQIAIFICFIKITLNACY